VSKVRRYDVRQIKRFHDLLARHPGAGLLLCALAILAGCALSFGWVGASHVRPSDGARRWIGAGLWWLFAAYVGALSVRELWRRRGIGS